MPVEYVSVADPDTLTELDLVDPARGALVSLAARLGRTRLIDNLVLAPVAPAPRPAGLDVSSHR